MPDERFAESVAPIDERRGLIRQPVLVRPAWPYMVAQPGWLWLVALVLTQVVTLALLLEIALLP